MEHSIDKVGGIMRGNDVVRTHPIGTAAFIAAVGLGILPIAAAPSHGSSTSTMNASRAVASGPAPLVHPASIRTGRDSLVFEILPRSIMYSCGPCPFCSLPFDEAVAGTFELVPIPLPARREFEVRNVHMILSTGRHEIHVTGQGRYSQLSGGRQRMVLDLTYSDGSHLGILDSGIQRARREFPRLVAALYQIEGCPDYALDLHALWVGTDDAGPDPEIPRVEPE